MLAIAPVLLSRVEVLRIELPQPAARLISFCVKLPSERARKQEGSSRSRAFECILGFFDPLHLEVLEGANSIHYLSSCNINVCKPMLLEDSIVEVALVED